MVPDLEIEICQIAELLAAQIKPSFLRQVALADPGQLKQRATKRFPVGQRNLRKKAGKTSVSERIGGSYHQRREPQY